MTAPCESCRVDRLCPEHLAERQRVVAQRLALLDRRAQLRQPKEDKR